MTMKCTEHPYCPWYTPEVEGMTGLNTYANLVDARMEDLLPPANDAPSILHEAMRYSALAPGKRLRPALCLESCRVAGGNPSLALGAACAIEFVHVFSLIHDDLPALDNDTLRRGQPTCHAKFGENIAIMAGDALFALAFAICPEHQVMHELALASMALVQGETMDILSEGAEPNAQTLAFIHQRKTVALIAASCVIGARLGGGSDQLVAALRTYGNHIGLAFQIADDLLNETATAEQLGKAAGSDRERKKMTYPAHFGVDESRRLAAEEVKRAVAALDGFNETHQLVEWAHFAISRES